MTNAHADMPSAAPWPSQERRLLAAARAGELRAQEQLLARHVALVRAVAARYRGLGLPVEDLVQEGSVGLLEAIRQFDNGREADFPAFALGYIRCAITRALADEARLVRLPRQVVERRRAVLRAWSTLATHHGGNPSVGDLVAASGLDAASVEALLALPASISLDEPLGIEGLALAGALADVDVPVPAHDALEPERQLALAKALGELSDRKRAVIAAHFGLDGDPRPPQQIGVELGLSPKGMRELEREALRELDDALRRPVSAPVAVEEAGNLPAPSPRRWAT